MKILIAEDDFVSRMILQEMLSGYGLCHVASDGKEALEAFKRALDDGDPYELICLDIMMPHLNGQEVLQNIRAIESDRGVGVAGGAKVLMTTALGDAKSISTAFAKGVCDGYLIKPIEKEKLVESIRCLGLIS